MRLIIIALMAVAIVGCGESARRSATYAHTAEIRDRLVAAGLGCTNYREYQPEEYTKEEASCDVNGASLPIYVFNNRGERDTYAVSDCGLVMGDFWAINLVAGAMEDAGEIADAVDAPKPDC